MPAKKKAPDTTQTPIAPVETSSTKAVKGKASTKASEVAPTVQVETKATSVKTKVAPTKAQPEAGKAPKAPKAPKEKLPKPVTITRTELAIEIVKAVGQYMTITGQESEAIISEIINTMIDSLKQGNKIEIRGFGSFRFRVRRSRVARNPKTGARVDVPSKSVVYFKIGQQFKASLITPTEANSTPTSKPVETSPTVEPAKPAKVTKKK